MGVKTLYEYFYKLAYGDKGADKATLVNDCLDIADAEIKANKDARHTQNADTDLDATFEATFAKKADKLSAFAATTSAELAGVISDETGSGKLVFDTSPTLVTPVLGVAAATSINFGDNALSAYKTGEWTMGVSFGGGTTGITYTENGGYYTKIGNLVIISGKMTLTSKGTSEGNAYITGLPFTVVNNLAGNAAMPIFMNGATFADQLMSIAIPNTTTIELNEISNAGAYSHITNADFTNNTAIIIGGAYRIN